MSTPKLKSLTIRKYLDVEPTTLHFHDKRNVLLGKNGSGKTTLLDLISAVLRWDFSAIESREFDIGFELAEPDLAIVVALKNELLASAPAVGNTESKFRASGTIEIIEDQEKTRLINDGEASRDSSGQILAIGSALRSSFFYLVFRSIKSLERRFGNIGATALRFDEGLDYYRLLFNNVDARGQLAIKRDPSGTNTQSSLTVKINLFPWPMTERMLRFTESDASIIWSPTDLPFLGRLCLQMQFSDAEYFVEAQEKRITESNAVEIQLSNLKARFHWKDGGFV